MKINNTLATFGQLAKTLYKEKKILWPHLANWTKPYRTIINTLATFGQLSKALNKDNKYFGQSWPNVANVFYIIT